MAFSSKTLAIQLSKKFKIDSSILVPIVDEILSKPFSSADFETAIDEAKKRQDKKKCS